MSIFNSEIRYGTCDRCGKYAEYLFFDRDEDEDEDGCVYPNPELCKDCCTELAQMFSRSATYYCKAIDIIEDYEQAEWEERQGGITYGEE